MRELTPEQVIQRIAQIATDVAWQAGVGAMETAGSLVSVLSAHPEKVRAFLAGELSVIDDLTLLQPDQGCLTWHAMSGKIIGPAEARAARRKLDH